MSNPPAGTTQFTNVAGLFGNHYRFDIRAFPDLTFFVQSASMPSIASTVVPRANPFSTIPEVGDHLTFNTFQVSYLIDTAFKTYFSLFYWLKGYTAPTNYQEILDFNAARRTQTTSVRPSPREIHKTTAVLTILEPDSDKSIAEVQYEDVFPTVLGEMTFETTDSEPPVLKTTVTFAYTDFQVVLTNL